MKRMHNIWEAVKWAIAAVLIVAVVGFSHKKQGIRACKNINVMINGQVDHFFIEEEDIINIITENGEKFILETPFEELNLKYLERMVRDNPFVRRADIYKDLKGNLIVEAEQYRPIARMMVNGKPDWYISADGTLFPESSKYTARVPLISGPWVDKLLNAGNPDSLAFDELYHMLVYINSDDFWRAQITQLEINRMGRIRIFPQVSKQVIEWGNVGDFEDKFNKLRIFYRDILPREGWNKYERVNLAYKNQIICE
jgi:cell division protein FtsQ